MYNKRNEKAIQAIYAFFFDWNVVGSTKNHGDAEVARPSCLEALIIFEEETGRVGG